MIRGTTSFGHVIGKDKLSRLHIIHYGRAGLAQATLDLGVRAGREFFFQDPQEEIRVADLLLSGAGEPGGQDRGGMPQAQLGENNVHVTHATTSVGTLSETRTNAS